MIQNLISIHALLAESDIGQSGSRSGSSNFYPRSPCGERLTLKSNIRAIINFYPRSPCGERLSTDMRKHNHRKFLSTLSLRRATTGLVRVNPTSKNFYPRSPCGERRRTSRQLKRPAGNFYPRSPCGERRAAFQNAAVFKVISIHALLAESDNCEPVLHQSQKHFYPRSPCGERLRKRDTPLTEPIFLSTLSLRRATFFQNQFFIHNLFLSTLSLRRAT